jgi:hypothetical protein
MGTRMLAMLWAAFGFLPLQHAKSFLFIHFPVRSKAI